MSFRLASARRIVGVLAGFSLVRERGESSLTAIHSGLWSDTAAHGGALFIPASVTRHAE